MVIMNLFIIILLELYNVFVVGLIDILLEIGILKDMF